jgi:predicted HicB family RNase H-like nuclease
MNTMTINGYQAVIAFDPDIQMFRGEFVGLNGGADFYAKDVDGLRREGEISLRVFLEACAEDGVDPRKHFSGKFSCVSIPNSTRPPPSPLRLMDKASTSGPPRRSGRRRGRNDGGWHC